ncbi:hypothetical protein MASR1M45_09440 [Candidatus Kapaibacterium sp.]
MKRITEASVKEEIPKYRHSITGQVKFHEVDSFGVVHNIQYFYFLEWARTKYLEMVGMPLTNKTFTADFPLMTVHHEMDYFNPLYFTDEYEIFSRTVKVGKSSIVMENIITNLAGDVCIKASVTLVHLSTENYRPDRLPQSIRNMIVQIEGDNVEVADNLKILKT